MFVNRAILAATLSPAWGVYGPAFELMEHLPVRAGSEEYLDSEKYQVRQWDLHRPDSLAPLLGRLNRIRREHPALHTCARCASTAATTPALLCYSKTDPAGVGPPILVVVNLDAAQPPVRLRRPRPASRSACPTSRPTTSSTSSADASYRWHGAMNFVDLDPSSPAHVFRVQA